MNCGLIWGTCNWRAQARCDVIIPMTSSHLKVWSVRHTKAALVNVPHTMSIVPKESSQQPKHGQACDNFLVSPQFFSFFASYILCAPSGQHSKLFFFLTSVKSAACKHCKGITAYRVSLLSWMSHVRPERESRRSRSRSRRRRRWGAIVILQHEILHILDNQARSGK